MTFEFRATAGNPPVGGDDTARSHDVGFVAGSGQVSELAISLLSAIPDCVKLIDLDGRLSSISHAGLCAMEITDFGAVRGRPWWSLWPEEAEPLLRRSVATAGAGGQARFTAFCPTVGGTPKWWDVSVMPVRDEEGRITDLVSVSRDVTALVEANRELERRRAEAEAALEQARLLLREVDHRVKNSLAMIVGLLRMQVRQVQDPNAVAALGEAARRVQTVARVHDRLYRSTEVDRVSLDDYLRHLCVDLGAALRGEEQAGLELELSRIWGSADQAVALGLIVAELVANAYRHAGTRPDDLVIVSLTHDGEAGDQACLVVRDTGQGLPPGFSPEASAGLGMRVVLAKVEELGGRFDVRAGPEGGAAFSLSFPLDAPQGEA